MAMITNTMPTRDVAAHARLERVDREQWEALARGFDDLNYRQLWSYGTLLARRRGALCEHVAVRGQELLGIADVRIKKLPVIGGGLAYVSGGPLFRCNGTADFSRFDACLNALSQEYVGKRGMTLRILPTTGSSDFNGLIAASLERNGFAVNTAVAGYRTFLVNIDRPLDQIRASFNGKWRNCLNAAERNGLTVTVGTAGDRFTTFAAMLEAMLQRKQFELDLDPHFYAQVQADLDDKEKFIISMVHEGQDIVAANVTGFHGDTAMYLLGATTETGMTNKASYLLQWNAIQLATQRGMRRYDLGGIDPEGNPGVYHFKKGLNGEDVSSVAYERTPIGIRAGMTRMAERAYVGVRKLRKGSLK